MAVSTKSPRSDKQYVWEAVADSSSYVIREESDPEKLLPRGTQITLYLKVFVFFFFHPLYMFWLSSCHLCSYSLETESCKFKPVSSTVSFSVLFACSGQLLHCTVWKCMNSGMQGKIPTQNSLRLSKDLFYCRRMINMNSPSQPGFRIWWRTTHSLFHSPFTFGLKSQELLRYGLFSFILICFSLRRV